MRVYQAAGRSRRSAANFGAGNSLTSSELRIAGPPTAKYCGPARLRMHRATILAGKSGCSASLTILLLALTLHRFTSLFMSFWAAKRQGVG
jgi:hypothetical protein